ncbi:BON domain-containing protein [Bdellovibrio bacteriovorus]|uniref:BON domain-containing protein n=1 Tax=Bdellovibrio bacteriovorus TaxID=959 RepID=UPI003AA91037
MSFRHLFIGLLISATACTTLAKGDDHYTTTTKETTTTTKATDQGMNESDTTLTRSIREKINSDDTMSMMGKNITIVSQNGMVTLKGAVASQNEKKKISRIANEISGNKVSDQMTVKK